MRSWDFRPGKIKKIIRSEKEIICYNNFVKKAQQGKCVADREAWEHLQRLDRAQYRSVNRAVISAVNAYFGRQEQLAADPYLETREKEDAFLREIQNTIWESLQTAAPMNFAPWMQLMQDAVPADTTEKPEESEDMDAALDFADSF